MWKFARDKIIIGSLPLHEAAQTGDIATMTELLEGGSGIEWLDEKGESPIFRAIRERQPEAMQFLLAHGANVNARTESKSFSDRTPLHVAAMKMDVGMMKMLLESGADIEAQDSTGQTPLGYAIWSEEEVRGEVPRGTMLATVNFLIAHGANVNNADNRGEMPLHYAKVQSLNKVADVLLKAGARP